MVSTTCCATCFRNNNQAAIQEAIIPNLCKDTNPYAHIRVLKKAIKTNGETMEVNIINLFGFTLRDNIFEGGENYVQDHPNYTFEELE
jgi:hypothetical protein